jgi:hypothetical protein
MTQPDDSTTVITTRQETTPRDQSATRQQPLTTADFASAGAPVERQTADSAETSPRREALFPGSESQTFQGRWSEIQTSFVDEPRRAVEQADSLVAEVMQQLAKIFADERSRLEQQWDRGEDTDTEALRQALRRYRSFFDRLLSL